MTDKKNVKQLSDKRQALKVTLKLHQGVIDDIEDLCCAFDCSPSEVIEKILSKEVRGWHFENKDLME